jgi:hypothetical protein
MANPVSGPVVGLSEHNQVEDLGLRADEGASLRIIHAGRGATTKGSINYTKQGLIYSCIFGRGEVMAKQEGTLIGWRY